MQFKTIPKLIGYRTPVCIDLESIKPTLSRLSTEYGANFDPDFQRGHVWSETQQVKFVEYVLRGGTVPPILFNSPAYGGDEPIGDLSDEIVLVDGKQRLTALLKFINNELRVFGHLISEFEDARYMLKTVWISYAVNKLQTKKELLTWYLEMNEGHIAHAPEELTRIREMLSKL